MVSKVTHLGRLDGSARCRRGRIPALLIGLDVTADIGEVTCKRCIKKIMRSSVLYAHFRASQRGKSL